jgi:hypothetical protein
MRGHKCKKLVSVVAELLEQLTTETKIKGLNPATDFHRKKKVFKNTNIDNISNFRGLIRP